MFVQQERGDWTAFGEDILSGKPTCCYYVSGEMENGLVAIVGRTGAHWQQHTVTQSVSRWEHSQRQQWHTELHSAEGKGLICNPNHRPSCCIVASPASVLHFPPPFVPLTPFTPFTGAANQGTRVVEEKDTVPPSESPFFSKSSSRVWAGSPLVGGGWQRREGREKRWGAFFFHCSEPSR